MKNVIIILGIILLILTACKSGFQASSQENDTQTSPLVKPSISTVTATEQSKTGIIGPENINQLQIQNMWGKGSDFGIALSPDETEFAVATVTGITIYDSVTFQDKQFIDLPFVKSSSRYYIPQNAISYSPDGHSLAVGYDDIIIWDLISNKIENWIRNQIADYDIVSVSFSPKGDSVAVVSMGSYAPCDAWGGILLYIM